MANKREQEMAKWDALSDEQRARVERANEILKEVCNEVGLNVCSLNASSGWNAFVDGKINEGQLFDRAREEMQPPVNAGAMPIALEEKDLNTVEMEKRQRAKRASEIYRQVCEDSGLNPCFFNSFTTWSDFVSGNMNENSFYEVAKEEAKRLLDQEGSRK